MHVERGDARHIFFCQGKVKDVSVFTDVIGRRTARHQPEPHLNVPPQDDLCGSLLMHLREHLKHRILQQTRVAMPQRIPGLQRDALLIAKELGVLSGVIGVALHLH